MKQTALVRRILLIVLTALLTNVGFSQNKVTAKLSTATSNGSYLALNDSITKYASKYRADTLSKNLYFSLGLKANASHAHTSSDITNFTSAARSAFSAGTGISITNGIITNTGGGGAVSGDGGLTEGQIGALLASKNAVNYVTDFGVLHSDKYPNQTFPNNGFGTGYTLSVYYSNLAAAQVDFPTATNINVDVVDGLMIQNAIDYALYDPASKSNVVYINYEGKIYLSRPIYMGYGINVQEGIFSRGYTSLHLLGIKPSAGEGNVTAEKGTVLIPLFNRDYAIGVQGMSKAVIQNITIIGKNGGIPKNGTLYSYAATKKINYIGDDMGSYDDEAHRYSPYSGIAVDPSSESSGDWATPPSGTTYLPYGDVIFNPKYDNVLVGTYSQWWKNVSTDVRMINVDIRQFITGVVVHPNGSDGNGDFVRMTESLIFNCMYGMSVCQTQARLTSFIQGQIDACWTAFTVSSHGNRVGRIQEVIGSHFSGYQVFNGVNMSFNGPISFINCYGEAIQRLGYFGYDIANGAHPTFINCDWNFGHQDAGYIPLNILSGYTAYFDNCRLYGANLDMSCELPPTINNCVLEVFPSTLFDATYPFSSDVSGGEGLFYRAFLMHPISTGKAKKIFAEGQNTVGVNARKGFFNNETAGTNAYAYPEFPNTDAGTSGLFGDYYWRSGYVRLSDGFTSYSNGKLIFNAASLGLTTQMVKDAIEKRDILENDDYGCKFMIYSRVGDVCEAVLLNGFVNNFSEHDFPLSIFTDVQQKWTWYNCNGYDVNSGLLDGNKQWPIKATATVGSNVLTNVQYVQTISTSRGTAISYIQPKTIGQYHNYTFDPRIPTSKTETSIIQSVNTTNNTITLKDNSTISGTVLFYNKYPYPLRYKP